MTNISFRALCFAAASVLSISLTAPVSAAPIAVSQANPVETYYGTGEVFTPVVRQQTRATERQSMTRQSQTVAPLDTNGVHMW